MKAATWPAGEVPKEVRIDVAEQNVTSLGPFSNAGYII